MEAGFPRRASCSEALSCCRSDILGFALSFFKNAPRGFVEIFFSLFKCFHNP